MPKKAHPSVDATLGLAKSALGHTCQNPVCGRVCQAKNLHFHHHAKEGHATVKPSQISRRSDLSPALAERALQAALEACVVLCGSCHRKVGAKRRRSGLGFEIVRRTFRATDYKGESARYPIWRSQ